MYKHFKNLAIAVAILFLLPACNGKKQIDTLPYSPYIDAFSSGTVPRHTPLHIVLAQDIPSEKIDTAALAKIVTISPKKEGQFVIEDSRHIIFFPKDGFERGTTYNVSVDLSKWFSDVKQKIFSFSFSTIPLELRASMESLNMSEDKDDSYDIVCNINTSDVETADIVKSLIELSESADTIWSSSGRKHRLEILNIPAGENGERNFIISTARNKLGLAREELLSIAIPDIKEFAVYDVVYNSDTEKYIEVTFTSTIDPNQKMEGLAYLDEEPGAIINVLGNKIIIYPGPELTGDVTVVLEGTIRNTRGETLGETKRMSVDLKTELPSLRFAGLGVITPRSGQLTVPFQAVYLRGVIVRVIQIKERNIGQFLQTNYLDGKSGLMRVGRLVARKTIFLDDDPNRLLYKWDTYSIDLSKLIEPEPGAIYRIELEHNRELSAYPCDNADERRSKELILANDELQFKRELEQYDEVGSYYYYDGYDYDNDYYYDSDYYKDPCQSSYYYYNTKISRNFLATDLGVVAKMGTDNNMKVSIHNIVTTKPEKGVSIAIYNYQNDLLAEGISGDRGETTIAIPSGKPYYLIASLGKQRSYMRLDDGSALSVSTFNVSGDVVHKGIKGFIYGERGVWRPGDTMHIAFMLNNSNVNMPEEHPVTMELYNPLGQLYTKKTESKSSLGLYRFDFPTDPDAPTGAWSIRASVGGASFYKTVRVETIKPNRLKIVLDTPDDKPLLDGTSINTPLHVEWLHGATARNLNYEIDVSFSSVTTTFKGYDDFRFDSPVKSFSSDDNNQITGSTDEEGNALLSNHFDIGSSAPGMLNATFITRVFEDSGDFSIDGFSKLFSPYQNYVGIKAPKNTRDGYQRLDTGTEYTYEIASVDYTGKPVSGRNIDIKVYKVTWYWWWSSYRSSLANYISNSHRTPVKEFSLRTDSSGKGSFNLKFIDDEWGSYYISVTDKDGSHSSGIVSYFDWPYYSGQRDMEQSSSANILTFKTDKDTYNIGEKISITTPSSEGSRAIVSIENGTRVVATHEFDCFGEESIFNIEATAEMQPGAYINITLLQPHAKTENDMPIRLYGIVPVTVTSEQSHLVPQITMVDEIKPEANYQITISEKNGREMAYTLAIVDEGLLDLTRFRTPEPWSVFNAREALGVRTWDMYSYIVGAYGGKVEQAFSIGGDGEAGAEKKATVNRFKPVVQYAGPFILKKGQKQSHSFTMDNYNGRVRVMVVAGDGKAYGNAEKSVLVRKPVMLLGTLPRIIGINEEMVIPATVFATEANVGNVSVTISCSNNMEIVGSSSQTLNFSKIEDKQTKFKVKVKGAPGVGKVTIVAQGKGEKSVYETDIEIRNVRRPVSKVVPVVLEANKTWSDNLTLPGTIGTNNLTLEFSSVPPLNLSRRLEYLLGYPHGCIEQITSKSFPQLYLKQIANLTKKQEILADQAIKETIRRYRSYSTNEGGFAYWPGNRNPDEWGSIYAAHFIAEAEAKGYLVPDNIKRGVVNYLQKRARNWQREDNRYYYRTSELTQAYRLYVLALHKSPEVGAMNRLKEMDLSSETTKWMLAASYALVGRKDVASGILAGTKSVSDDIYDEYDYTYGSSLRDKAIKLQTLVLLERGEEAAVATKEISDVLSSDVWLSTQSTAFALMSVSTYMNRYSISSSMDFTYKVAGNKSESVKISKAIWSTSIFEAGENRAAAELKNNGTSTIFARFIMEGIPEQGAEEAYSRGVKISVSYVDMYGDVVDVTNLPQGANFRAVVTVENPTEKTFKNLVLTEMFPSGWEIINTRYMDIDHDSDDNNSRYINYQDFRDDRVYSYIDRLPSGKSVKIEIALTAIYAGKFYLPPVYCEAMYDNLIRANNEGKQVVVQ
jgi:Large extracellular alpha-helical protein